MTRCPKCGETNLTYNTRYEGAQCTKCSFCKKVNIKEYQKEFFCSSKETASEKDKEFEFEKNFSFI